MSQKKTREEKIKSAYRLQNFRLKEADIVARRDVEEFGYLSKKYVKKDLLKTAIYSGVVIGLLFVIRFVLI